MLAEGSGVAGAPSVVGTPPKRKGASASSSPSSLTWQDYMRLIESDPVYQQTIANEKAASIADAGQLGSGILSALVNRGVVPDLAGIGSKLGLSPAVLDWIRNNVNLGQASALAASGNKAGTSLQSQLDQEHKTALGNISDTLAARGLLRSGATPELTGNEAQRYKLANYNADKALADYISGAYAAFTNNEHGRQGELTSALTDAYTRALQGLGSAAPPSLATPAAPASSVPETTIGGNTQMGTGGPVQGSVSPRVKKFVLHSLHPSTAVGI